MTSVEDFYKNLPQYEIELEELLNPNIKRRGRKRKNKMYFTPITEKAIIAYNTEEGKIKRDKVYSEHIHYALWKLSQNIINRFKFPYMYGTTEDKQYEVIGFILQKLNKYAEDKGRAFSYFSIVAKNYCIQANNKAYAKLILSSGMEKVDSQRNLLNEESEKDRQEELSDFVDLFIMHYDKKIETAFKDQDDKKIAYAILELFKRRVNIEKYNKKALYLMIREMTNEKTKDISRIVNYFKHQFREKQELYNEVAKHKLWV